MNGCKRLLLMGATLIAAVPTFDPWSRAVLGQTQAESLSSSFRKAAERIAPAVVSIRPVGVAVFPQTIPPVRPLEGAPRWPVFLPGDCEREPLGSGVVIDADKGYILTTDHGLLGSSQAAVVLGDGRERLTTQIRRDPGFDLAVLVIDPSGLNLTSATWGDPAALQPGDWVLSIGRSGGGGAPALSAGIFSARRRGVGTLAPGEEWLETDAAVNSLNSGGPLVSLNGEVVGINTPLAGRRGPIAGIGFAMPADKARRIAADLIALGQVRRAYLGVQIEPGAPGRGGVVGSVLIASVAPGTPAAEAGLNAGDVIVSIGGRPVDGIGMAQEVIESSAIGEELTLTIERGGRRQELKVRPRARPAAAINAGPRPLPEVRREVLRGRPRARPVPRQAPPAPVPAAPRAGEEAPLSLDPVPAKPAQPGNSPSLESPKDQPREGPR